MEALIIVAATLVLAYCAYRILKKKLTDETVMAQNLAAKFKWQFVKEPNAQGFNAAADHMGFQANAIRVPYFISGNIYDRPFELFLIMGSMKGPHLQSTYGNVAITYATVIRTHEVLSSHIAPRDKVSFFAFGEWNYIVYGANAMTEREVLGLLSLLGPQTAQHR